MCVYVCECVLECVCVFECVCVCPLPLYVLVCRFVCVKVCMCVSLLYNVLSVYEHACLWAGCV